MQTAPIDIFSHIGGRNLNLNNYALNDAQTKPLSFVLPFLSNLKELKVNDCHLSDTSAGLLAGAVLGNNATKVIHMDGIDVGQEFVSSLREAIDDDPSCLEELSLKNCKMQKTLVELLQILRDCTHLKYLKLASNTFTIQAAQEIALLLVQTSTLEYLNLSFCQIREKLALLILEGLMRNTTLTFLNLSMNSFKNKTCLLASMLGRVLSGHP